MTDAAVQLLPYALVAAASPLGLAATLTAMRAGRLKAAAFAAGALIGQLLACGALVALGTVAERGRGTAHPALRASLELALGLVLLVLAFRVHRGAPPASDEERTRGPALLDRLAHVGTATAAVVGVVLGIGGPKRLVLSALAAATVAAEGLRRRDEAGLVLWYGVVATLSVWAPVLAYLLLGDRVVGWVDDGFDRLNRHRRPVTVWSLALVGGFLAVDALVRL